MANNSYKSTETINSTVRHILGVRNVGRAGVMDIGTSFTRIRIGLRCGIRPDSAPANIAGYTFYLGLTTKDAFLDGSDLLLTDPNVPGRDFIDHFIGMRLNSVLLDYQAGQNAWDNNAAITGEMNFVAFENNVKTFEQTAGEGHYFANDDAGDKLTGLFFEINKTTATNWAFRFYYPKFTSGADLSDSDFDDIMGANFGVATAASPHAYGDNQSYTAVDEPTHGDLDSFAWFMNSNTNPLEIDRFAIALPAG